jgi:hypothetical protein
LETDDEDALDSFERGVRCLKSVLKRSPGRSKLQAQLEALGADEVETTDDDEGDEEEDEDGMDGEDGDGNEEEGEEEGEDGGADDDDWELVDHGDAAGDE